MENYRCSVCGKEHVKLWRPIGDDDPLMCAECIEKNQSAQEYEKMEWTFNSVGGYYVGNSTGEMIQGPKWKVDENGEIPDYSRDVVSEKNRSKTKCLMVDISDISPRYAFDDTMMVPAIPIDGTDLFYTLPPSDNEAFEWWCELPTR